MSPIDFRRSFNARVAIALALLLAGLSCASCDQQERQPSTGRPAESTAAKAGVAPDEYWDAYFMQGAKLGYAHTKVTPIQQDGRQLVRTESKSHVEIVRFSQRTEQEMSAISVETPEGQLVSLIGQTSLGAEPETLQGFVDGDRLILTWSPKARRAELPWSSDNRGYFGIEQSLQRDPIAPGDSRTLKVLLPVLNQISTVKLKARDYEATKMLEGELKLLRIDTVTELGQPAGAKVETTIWVDAKGRPLKTRTDALDQETYRTTEAVATAKSAGPQFDIGRDTIIKVDPIPSAHRLREIRYRATLKAKKPSDVFAVTRWQQVKSTGPNAAELTVRAVQPCQGSSKDPPPQKDALEPNSIITSNDASVVAMADQAAGKLSDPCEVAVALEKFVHREVREKNFSQAFATAAEVATLREGDCTEHAVLLAALARAKDIPSRVAIGLVYVEDLGGFGYHMWTEVYVGGSWTPLDATLGRGGIGPAHLKLTDSTLAGDSPYSSFLAVINVLGRLKLEVLATR